MEQLDVLYDLLNESAEVYECAVKTGCEKYDAAVKNDIDQLNDIISKEQVFYLKIKGLEQKIEKITSSIDLRDKSLKEIIEFADVDDKIKLKLIYDRLFKALSDFKKINDECKTIIEIRLHRIDNVMAKLWQKENSYTENSIQKKFNNHMLSKKI